MDLLQVYKLWDIEPVRGLGTTLWDKDGVEYTDLYGGHAVISIGHCHPHYVEMLSAQLGRLGFYSNAVQNSLQKELAAIFQSQTRMMPGVLVSVTRVRISPDLSICTANLSVFPSERGEEIIKNIQANEKKIRYELGTRVRNQLRIIPELRFFIDDSLDYLEKIDELLKK